LIALVAGAVPDSADQPAKKLSTPVQKDAAVQKEKVHVGDPLCSRIRLLVWGNDPGTIPQQASVRQAYYRMRKRCQVDETKGGDQEEA
jgi:hypothetical protein